jgi:hypothetical protein
VHGLRRGKKHRCSRHVLAAALSLCALAAAEPALAASPSETTAAQITAQLTPPELALGSSATISGTVTEAAHGMAGAPVLLQSDPYPFGAFATVARTETGPSGSFRFAELEPDRNARLRVVLEGQPNVISGDLQVTVDPVVAIGAHTLGPGRTRLSVRIRHARIGGAGSVSASWFVQARGSHVFRLAAVSSTREIAAGLLYASAIVDPPSKRFAYRVCINPPWEHAMGASATHGRCPTRDFVLPVGHAG